MGNQLFKFANGLRVAEQFENKLVLDISWYKHNYMKSNRVSSREFELDYFPEIKKIDKYVSSFPRIDKFRGKFERRLRPDIQRSIGLMTEFNQEKFERSPICIDGSFERTIFLPNSDVLRWFLKFPSESSEWYEENLKYNFNRYVVAVHVRRTDYLNLAHIYDVVDKAYYLKAINEIYASNKEVALHLFSDDPDGAIRWLGDSIKFDKIISQPINIPSGEVLRLMSTYDSIIAANSTFSWWAAYIGKLNKNVKKIFLPKKFSNLNNDNPENFLWIQDCQFI